ncbi:MAG: NADH-quinone oxidoreductase subunit NuoG [Rudaea sp.]
MPKITIDGKIAEVPANTLVVEAAKLLGVHIPVFCYHPKLEPVGMCRLCLVEVGTPRMDPATRKPVLDAQGNPVTGWMPKLQTACTTVVSEGMSVRTNSPAVADARRSILEFLLTSHPLDCPICDKGGECPLQDHTLAYGPGVSRFRVQSKFHNEKRVPLSPLIMLDRERCIQCARCIRFQKEYADEPVLGFAERARGLEIVTLDDPPFDSKYSGNTIDICPVGALTSRDFRFSARVFEVNDQPSVCSHCSVGCNVYLAERDSEIQRITPRENEAVNEIWLCDKGRFVHHYSSSRERLSAPLVRQGAEFVPVSWYDAIAQIVSRFNTARIEVGGNAFAGLAGDRVANEDLYLFQKLFREVIGSNNIDRHIGWSQWNAGEDLARQYGPAVGTNLGELGKNASILVLGADPDEEQPVIRLRLSKSARQGANLVVAGGRLTKLSHHAKSSLVYHYGGELAFLQALLRILADEGLFKNALPEELRAELDKEKLEEYAKRCGLAVPVLQAAARSLVSTENLLLLFGREFMFAMQQDAAIGNALAVLAGATGHYGRKDNGLIALLPHNNSMGAFDMGVDPEVGPGGTASAAKGMPLKDILKSRLLYVMGCDPARDVPGFRRPNFMVVQDLFLTETAKQADIILPAQSWAERDGTFTNTERRVQLFRAGIKPRKGTKADWAIIQEIARGLGANWDYRSTADVMREITERVPAYAGVTYDRLAITARRRSSVLTVGAESVEPVQIALGELYGEVSGVHLPAGAELEPNLQPEYKSVESQVQVPAAPATPKPGGPARIVPSVVEKVRTAVGAPATAAEGKTLRLAVARSLYDCGTLVGKTAIVQPRVPRAYVELNSHDAEDLGIDDGARVRLIADARPALVLDLDARVDGRVPPGVALVPNNLDGTMNLPMGAQVRLEKAVA